MELQMVLKCHEEQQKQNKKINSNEWGMEKLF